MSKQGKTYFDIEAFLKGEMTEEETAAFKKGMETDPGLSDSIFIHKAVDELIIANRLQKIKGICLEEHTALVKSKRLKLFLIAAAALLLSGFLALSLVSKKPKGESPVIHKEKKANNPVLLDKERAESNTGNTILSANIGKNKPRTNRKMLTGLVLTKADTGSKINTEDSISNVPAKTAVDISLLKTEKTISSGPVQQVKSGKDEQGQTGLCKDIDLVATIQTVSTCIGEAEGSIVVSGLKGGTPPLKYKILNTLDNTEVKSFSLPSGTYEVNVFDRKGCEKAFPGIRVEEKICEKAFHFNPFLGESFTLPKTDVSALFIVYSPAGTIYYKKDIASEEQYKWDGSSSGGETIPGYYIFYLKKSNGIIEKGSITISR